MRKGYVLALIITIGLLLITLSPYVIDNQPLASVSNPYIIQDKLVLNANSTSNSSSPLINVYIVSTYPGQPQQLFAYPGQSGVLMYPYWNITISTSALEVYSVYVNGDHVSNGSARGMIYSTVYLNGSVASAVVGVGNHIYNFKNLPISVIPLSQKYAPKPPVPIYTQAFLDLFKIKTIVGAILVLFGSIAIVGQMAISKKERSIISN